MTILATAFPFPRHLERGSVPHGVEGVRQIKPR